MTAPAASARTRRFFTIGTSLWVLALVIVSVMVARDPERRSVTPVFHLAAERWAARHDLYTDPRGYHYLPQFAVLFMPFHALPVPAGDILWRALSVGSVLAGFALVLRSGRALDPGRAYLLATLLALAPCLGAVRNGQTNLAFGGLCLLLAAALSGERWSLAALCLVALVALKPLGLVLVLLAPWPYPRLRVPLLAGLVFLAALPFLAASPAYAAAQYRSAAALLRGGASRGLVDDDGEPFCRRRGAPPRGRRVASGGRRIRAAGGRRRGDTRPLAPRGRADARAVEGAHAGPPRDDLSDALQSHDREE
jgi:hypothetical protein